MGSARVSKGKKPRATAATAPPPAHYSPETQELRALLRRVPDGFQATLNALAARPVDSRERSLIELAKGMGKEILPLFRAAGLGKSQGLALSALQVLPVFGTRAAGELLHEVYEKITDPERRQKVRESALAFQARGIQIAIGTDATRATPSDLARLTLRETSISAPDGVGSRSIAARFQDHYGVWHAILVMWNDRAGVKDGFMRPFSRREWEERVANMAQRGLRHAVCPPDYARWSIEQARTLNELTRFPVGQSLKDWDRLMGPPPAEYVLPVVPVVGDEDLEEDSPAVHPAELLFLEELVSWGFEVADVAPHVRPWLREMMRLRADVDGAAQEGGPEMRQFLAPAVNQLLDETQLSLFRGRLEDLARFYHFRGEAGPASAAQHVVNLISAGTPPGEIDFFAVLMERTLYQAAELMRRGSDLEELRYRPLRRYQY